MDIERTLNKEAKSLAFGGLIALMAYALRIGTKIDIATFPQSVSFLGMTWMVLVGAWFESKRMSPDGLDGKAWVILGLMYTLSFVITGSETAWKSGAIVTWIFIGAVLMAFPGYSGYIWLPVLWIYGLLVSGMQGHFMDVAFLNEGSGGLLILEAIAKAGRFIMDALRGGLIFRFL
ncbi:hypothetical protein DRN58_02810 [Thermococci archaeon]|nr:MAG: hypothetical protein DRN58_02810 [Thermococci archaeon]